MFNAKKHLYLMLKVINWQQANSFYLSNDIRLTVVDFDCEEAENERSKDGCVKLE